MNTLVTLLLLVASCSKSQKIEQFIESTVLSRKCSDLPKFSDISSHLEYLPELLSQSSRPSTRSLEEYVQILLPYIECSPPPAKVTRRPFNLTYDCKKPNWLGPRPKPLRVVDIFPVAHELDVLEMRLFELNDVVDEFVLFENMYTHRVWKRPLFYERNKFRYLQFQDKIVHIVADDTALAKEYNSMSQREGNDFRGEEMMRYHPWRAYKAHLGNDEALKDTIFIHSDLDEVPNAQTILQYKHCIPAARIDLPVVLTATFFRHNFDWVIWDDEKPILFAVEHMDGIFQGKLPRFTAGKVKNKHNDPNERSYTISYLPVNRMTNAYGDIFKDLALAEGGYVPRGPDMGRQIILDPLKTNEWRRKGIRNCCDGDVKHLKRRGPQHTVPWYAWHNKHRFSDYFPDECSAYPTDCNA